ncbi:MAG: SRPBCC family protein [Prevotella sp.]|jgi:carbon monoxide dehydrogenase subunit G|nr:SRPBCC family protein [Prevotella sp.]
MTDFVSEIKTIPCAGAEVYAILSDLRNLDKVRENIPQEKIKNFSCDRDSCSVSVEPVGQVKFNIIEREPVSTIKFEAEQIPFGLNVWIQLKPSAETETKMKLTLRADLNVFLKPMLSKPLQQAVDKIAEMIAAIPYGDMATGAQTA